MTFLIIHIIGQFKFIEGHQTSHQSWALTGRVMVWKRPELTLVVVFCYSTRFPFGVAPAVLVLIYWNDGQEQAVHARRLQARQAIAAIWEHTSPLLGENHFSRAAVELRPHAIVLQCNADTFVGQYSRKVTFCVWTLKCGEYKWRQQWWWLR